MRALHTPHGQLELPAFLPDATRAVVRTVDSADLAAAGVPALMVNALHLSSHPGTTVISAAGGIHRFMGWDGPVASDSGGFQVYSLLRQSPNAGHVSPDGFSYRLAPGHARKLLTPEKCIRLQLRLGADIVFCLDECTHPGEPAERQRECVQHTVDWARRCKAEFERSLGRRLPSAGRPLLFSVVQGGADGDLRRQCAEALLALGFDGYGYGGWPVHDNGALVDTVGYVAELMPPDVPKHALGIGSPENLVRCSRMGYGLFDCTMPTRDARHGRLFIANEPLEGSGLEGRCFYDHLHIHDERFRRDYGPVDPTCDCLCCHGHSRAYLRHLFSVDGPLAQRLATIHNLRFYTRLVARLRVLAGTHSAEAEGTG